MADKITVEFRSAGSFVSALDALGHELERNERGRRRDAQNGSHASHVYETVISSQWDSYHDMLSAARAAGPLLVQDKITELAKAVWSLLRGGNEDHPWESRHSGWGYIEIVAGWSGLLEEQPGVAPQAG
jgi:hypothetical protein